MRPSQLVVMLILHLAASSIIIGIKPKVPRCMIEYIAGSGAVSTIKVKMQFSEIANLESGEHFLVTLRNTETQQVESKIVTSGGRYYKEAEFDKNVIYELCVIFRTERPIEATVDYEAENKFEDATSMPKVPEHLLKKEDFKQAFLSASHLAKTINDFTLEHKQRKSQENMEFILTEDINGKLTFISAIEVVVLVGAGMYQFFALKNYLSAKQYI